MDSDDDYHIEIRCPGNDRNEAALLEEAIRLTLRRHRRNRCRISLAVVGDADMAELHRRYLGRTGPTDCLSFDLRDDGDTEAVEGEIIISRETARRESQSRGVAEIAELALYAVHGLLHLLGYDDGDERAAADMHRMEDQLLGELGLGTVYGAPPQ